MNWKLMDNAITLSDKLKLVKFILTSDRYTNGPRVREFESAWNKWVGAKHSLMVSSGSTANFLLLAAVKEKFNLKDGDKVLVPACTWVTNISPVIQLGLTPIFCDINLVNYSFDLDHMKQIKEAHPDIKLIFVTHLLGFSAENNEYQKIFPTALILDDVCESTGAVGYDEKKVGANSLGGTFSFYFGHHMTTVEGGMVCTNDSELYDLMRMKRSHGMARESENLAAYKKQYPNLRPEFLFMTDGYNFRSTELNAIIGLNQLKRMDKNIGIRQENSKKFSILTNDYHDLLYPVVFSSAHSNYAFPVICKNINHVEVLKELLNKNNVEHRPIVSGNLLKQPFLKNYNFAVPKEKYNVDILHDNGLYVGNSQFVNDSHLTLLRTIFDLLRSSL